MRATIGAWGVLVAAPLFAVATGMGLVVLSLPCGGTMRATALCCLGATAFVSALSAGWSLAALLAPHAHVGEPS